MTANLRIVPRNFHDEATLSVTEAAGSFPISETQNHARDSAWRSATTGTVTVSGTFTRARTANFFGMFRHRCHGGKVQLELFSDTAWISSVYDSTALAVNKIVGGSGDTAYAWGDDPYGLGPYDPLFIESPYWLWFATQTFQSYQITLSDHSTTFWPDYWQISRLWLGKYFEPRINPSYDGHGLGWVDNGDNNRTAGGSLRSNLGARWREGKMTLNSVDEHESPVWMDITANSRTGKDVVSSLFPEDGTRRERDNILCCKFASLDPLGRQVGRLTKNLAIREL